MRDTISVASSTEPSVSLACRVMSSRNREHEFAGGLTTLQIAMRFRGAGQRIGPVDAQLQVPALDPLQYVAGAPKQFLARQQVMGQARTRQEEGAFAVQHGRIEGRHGAAGLAEERER